MSLDRLAQEATVELLERTSPDPVALLADLRRTRRRRATGRGVGLVAALALVAGGWVVVRGDDASPRPAEPARPAVRNGALVSTFQNSHSHWRVDGPSVVDGELAFMPDNAVPATDVAFTRDGSELVYTVAGEIWALDVRTDATRVLAKCPAPFCEVTLSPDGRELAMAAGSGLRILTVGSQESQDFPLRVAGIRRPRWSPDGRSIAFLSTDGIYVVSADGTGLRLLHRLNGYISGGPMWSPDGSRIAFVEGVAFGETLDSLHSHFGDLADESQLKAQSHTLTTIRTDGSDLRRIRTAGRCDDCLHPVQPAVAWSPDGTLIALATPHSEPFAPQGVFVMRPDGSDVRQLSSGMYGATLAWQPLPR
jgi:hypothetical protein